MGGLEITAAIVAGIGTIISLLFNVLQKIRLNNKMGLILSSKKLEIERKLMKIELEKLKLENEIIQNQLKTQMREMKLSKRQLDEVQESFKYDFLNELNKREKELLIESLEQKHLSGQVDYLNKLLHLGGIEKLVSIKEEKKPMPNKG